MAGRARLRILAFQFSRRSCRDRQASAYRWTTGSHCRRVAAKLSWPVRRRTAKIISPASLSFRFSCHTGARPVPSSRKLHRPRDRAPCARNHARLPECATESHEPGHAYVSTAALAQHSSLSRCLSVRRIRQSRLLGNCRGIQQAFAADSGNRTRRAAALLHEPCRAANRQAAVAGT